ncbi:MAG: hypothetical protein H6621_02875 [Halobacteriovoraceae bacterium]|nr:hypothetical protein [Halobacteriovoraceae bacterium]MCB9093988.1 hypothetical protein [Halobacteriovoraceae bacterium]
MDLDSSKDQIKRDVRIIEKTLNCEEHLPLYLKIYESKYNKKETKKTYIFLYEFGESHFQLLDLPFVKNLIGKENVKLVFWDYPGHGLSAGDRGHVENMNILIESFKRLLGSVPKGENVQVVTMGNSFFLLLGLFKNDFVFANQVIKKVFSIDINLFDDNITTLLLSKVDLPNEFSDLYKLRFNKSKKSEDILKEEALTWNFWRQYLKFLEGIGEALYFVDVHTVFILTQKSSKKRSLIDAVSKLLINSEVEILHFENNEKLSKIFI